MNTVYLLTGGNMGDRDENLLQARKLIAKQCGDITAASSVYETAAWGKTDQPSFLNQALQIQTVLEPEQLLKQILQIEKKIGRVRNEKYGQHYVDLVMV